MTYSLSDLNSNLRGLLAFPLTPFTDDGSVDEATLREHVSGLIDAGVNGIFAAGGTGEFFSLTVDEYEKVVATCVDEVAGQVPVVAGLGYGTSVAIEMGQIGVRAGADGFLVLPPYLVKSGQEGLEAHYRQIAEKVPRGLIVYQRDNAVFEVETVVRLTEIENVIGFKDGIGRTEDLSFLTAALDLDQVLVVNGMPTAELHARTFAAHGVTTYSSAILDFLPEVSTQFYQALLEDDADTLDRIRDSFIVPLSDIRRRVPGYAVSLVKAGARLRGLDVGGVRPPLVDPTPEEEAELLELMQRFVPTLSGAK